MSTVLFNPVKAQSKITDSVIVAFSGGKESFIQASARCAFVKGTMSARLTTHRACPGIVSFCNLAVEQISKSPR